MNDLQARAELAIKDIVLPYVKEDAFSGEDIHIAIVSHGLCISELVSALMRLDHFKAGGGNWTGLLNTAWTRVAVDTVASSSQLKTLSRITQIYKQAKGNVGTHIPLEVRVTHINEHPHLLSMVRAGHASSHLEFHLIVDLQKRQDGGTEASNKVTDLTEADTEY